VKPDLPSSLPLNNNYRREILWVLVIKLALIVALKQAFFNTPVSDSLTPETVGYAIIGLESVISLPSSSAQEISK